MAGNIEDKYKDFSRESLLKIIEKLEARKRYGLIWDEEKVKEQFEKDAKNALPILKEIKGKEIGSSPNEPTNILIEGDNYHALSVLNFTHQGKIDVIYVDPPYNTGARDWKYNNNYVDASDSFKHSKWISFMYKRLYLAKSVLAEDGIICITIDDYELPRLLMIMEEIFGEDNYLGTAAIRINPGGRKTKRGLARQHEYALFFAKNPETQVAKIIKDVADKTHTYKEDKNGWYEERNLRKEGQDSLALEKSARFYPIYFDIKSGVISTKRKFSTAIWPIDTKGQKRIWRRGKNDIDNLYARGDLLSKNTKHGIQIYFKFRGGVDGETPKSFWENVKFSASEHGTQVLDKILGQDGMFNFPKSWYAVAECIRVCSSRKDAIVLDFFAGSGTTGHAVMEMNKEDGGTRQYILCTNNEVNGVEKELRKKGISEKEIQEYGICRRVTYPRIEKVIKGYKNSKGEKIVGLGSNLKYFKTDFVKKTINKDDMKMKLTRECTEMLCLREGIFDVKKRNSDFAIFEQNGHVMAVYYAIQRKGLKELKKELDKMKGEKVLYCFTLDPLGLDKADFIGWKDTQLEPIPQKILDVYEEIYEY